MQLRSSMCKRPSCLQDDSLKLVVKVATLHCMASILLPLAKEQENLLEYRYINHRGALANNPSSREVSPGSKFR